jgi:hypothetical protein
MGLSDLFHVGQIAQPAGSDFRCDQVSTGDEECLQSAVRIDNGFYPLIPRGIEFHSIHCREDVNRNGRMSEAKESGWVGKITNADALERCAEFRQCRLDGLCIDRIRFNQNIEIFRRARLRMEGDSVAANDQILNAVGVEDRQEFDEVWEHSCLTSSTHTPQERFRPPPPYVRAPAGSANIYTLRPSFP